MDSKERVRTALSHQDPDRTPVDFWWSDATKRNLLRELHLPDSDALQDYLGTDIRSIYPSYVGPKLRRFQDGSYEDFWGIVRTPFRHGRGGEYDEVLSPPLATARSLRDIEAIAYPSPDWFDYDSLRPQCERYNEHAIVVGRMGRETQTVFIQLWYFRGFSQILEDLIVWPEFVHELIDKIMKFRLEHLRRILSAVKGRADILQLADDYGTQNGPLIGVETWREYFAGPLGQMADMAHEAGLRVFLHCDGGIRPLIPDLVRIGIDILNPIQPHCTGMTPTALKRDFGDQLSFHGGIDTQTTLPFGTVADVEAEVRQRIGVLGAGGGYVLAPVHTVEPDVPLENLLAVYRTAGSYSAGRTTIQ